MRVTWVTKDGKIHEGNHLTVAFRLFPKSKNPELACEKAGFVKTGMNFSNSPYMENYDEEQCTQAQINSIKKLWEEHYAEKNKKI